LTSKRKKFVGAGVGCFCVAFMITAIPVRSRALIRSLADEQWEDKKRPASALEKITGKDFGEDAETWGKWWEENRGTVVDANEEP